MFDSLKSKIKGVLGSFSKKVKDEVEEKQDNKKEDKKQTKVKETIKKQDKAKAEKHKDKAKKSEKKIKKVEVPETFNASTQNFEPDINKTDLGDETKKDSGRFFGKLFGKKKEELVEDGKDKHESTNEPKEDKGIFGKIKDAVANKTLSEDKFNELFQELEIALFENNVAVEVVEKIKEDLRNSLVNQYVKRSDIDKIVVDSLRNSVDSILSFSDLDIIKEARKKKPYIICFLGINGSGKSTTIAKIAHLLQKNDLSCVIAAADTFRAAAIEQLGEWAKKLNIKMVSHEYGADPAAVAFDAIKYAEAHHINVVLIDTAGRLHSNKNLMNELQKIIRVAKPDLKLFVGESITGNDCIEQAVEFNNAVSIDGIILSKVDVDDKGGTAVSISYVTKKPILYIGVGQELKDLEEFDKEKVLDSLGLK